MEYNINNPNVEIYDSRVDVYVDEQITTFVMKTPEKCRIVDSMHGYPAVMFDLKVM